MYNKFCKKKQSKLMIQKTLITRPTNKEAIHPIKEKILIIMMAILCLTHWKATFQLPKTTDRPHTFRNWWGWREKTNGNKTDNSKPLAWNTSVKRISILMTIITFVYSRHFTRLYRDRQTDGRTKRSVIQTDKKRRIIFQARRKKSLTIRLPIKHMLEYRTIPRF